MVSNECPFIKVIEAKFIELGEKIDDLKLNYVRREEFNPVKAIVYGAVGIVLIGLVGAGVKLILTFYGSNTQHLRTISSFIVNCFS